DTPTQNSHLLLARKDAPSDLVYVLAQCCAQNLGIVDRARRRRVCASAAPRQPPPLALFYPPHSLCYPPLRLRCLARRCLRAQYPPCPLSSLPSAPYTRERHVPRPPSQRERTSREGGLRRSSSSSWGDPGVAIQGGDIHVEAEGCDWAHGAQRGGNGATVPVQGEGEPALGDLWQKERKQENSGPATGHDGEEQGQRRALRLRVAVTGTTSRTRTSGSGGNGLTRSLRRSRSLHSHSLHFLRSFPSPKSPDSPGPRRSSGRRMEPTFTFLDLHLSHAQRMRRRACSIGRWMIRVVRSRSRMHP
ncbi:hypothetical protein DFH06DRAFT_525177, partial [Mycena polygramma]